MRPEASIWQDTEKNWRPITPRWKDWTKSCGPGFFKPDGNFYKKNFTPEGTPENLRKWFQMKNIAFTSDYRIEEGLFDRSILDTVEKGF